MVANVASAAVPLLLLPLLTRVLTPEDYGQVVVFALLVTLFQCATGANVHAALGVIWFRRPHDAVPSYVGAALSVALASTILAAALGFLVFSLLPDLLAGITPLWAVCAAVTAGANIVLQSRLVLWQSQGRVMQSALVQFLTSLVNVGLSLLAVLALGWGGQGRNFGVAAAAVLMAGLAVSLFLHSREARWAPDRAQFSYLLGFGLPLVFHSFAGVLLTTADRWAISIQLDAAALGVYGAGAQLGMTMAILGDAFVKAYSPWIYRKLSDGTTETRYSVIGAIYAAMPLFFVMAFCLWCVLAIASQLLLGSQYQLAASYLPWFMLGGAFNGVYLCTAVLYFHHGRTSRLAMISFLSGLVGAGATWFFVALGGVGGAAMAYAFSQALLALATTVVASRTFDLPWFEPRRALNVWAEDLPFPVRRKPITPTEGK